MSEWAPIAAAAPIVLDKAKGLTAQRGTVKSGGSQIADAHWVLIAGACGDERRLITALGLTDKRQKASAT